MFIYFSIPKAWLLAGVLILATLLAIGAVPSSVVHGPRHRLPAHVRRHSLSGSAALTNAGHSAYASRSQQKQFKVDQPLAPASEKMIFMKRKTSQPLHKRTYTNREIHDDYEKQQHRLEAALEHYVSYGDSESLQEYLAGFHNPSNKSHSQPQHLRQPAPKGQQKIPTAVPSGKTISQSKSHGKNVPDEECEPDDQAPERASSGNKTQDEQSYSEPQQQQRQSEPQSQSQSQHQQQDQQQPQQQSKDVQKQQQGEAEPKHQQQSSPKPEPHPDTTKSQGSTESHGGSDTAAESGNSVWGYTPPSFDSVAAPATVSLYAVSSTPFRGHATFYGTGMGACGVVNRDDQPIVAVSRDIFEQYNPSSGNPNHNSLCGRRLEITWNGKKQQAFAMDECPGCQTSSLDLSPNLFKALDNPDKGDLDGITWKFV